jgi:hypothetical protein
VIADGDAELDRFDGPRLADDLVPGRELGCGFKGKFRGIAGVAKFSKRDFLVFDVHGRLLLLYALSKLDEPKLKPFFAQDTEISEVKYKA